MAEEKYDLIRTVDHTCDDGSEIVLNVRAMVTKSDVKRDVPGVAIVSDEDGDGSVIVWNIDHAERLFRAMKAALIEAGHEVG